MSCVVLHSTYTPFYNLDMCSFHDKLQACLLILMYNAKALLDYTSGCGDGGSTLALEVAGAVQPYGDMLGPTPIF